MNREQQSPTRRHEMQMRVLRTISLAMILLGVLGRAGAVEGAKSDTPSTPTVHVRLALEQKATPDKDGWLIAPIGKLTFKVESDAPLRLVQFYAIRVRAGEVPRRIRDDAEPRDGFTAEFTASEAATWNFWADAYTLRGELIVSNTLRVITRAQASPSDTRPQR